MLVRILLSVVVWVVVAIVLELLGQLLKNDVGAFLANNNVLLGFLAGVVYFFFGGDVNRR